MQRATFAFALSIVAACGGGGGNGANSDAGLSTDAQETADASTVESDAGAGMTEASPATADSDVQEAPDGNAAADATLDQSTAPDTAVSIADATADTTMAAATNDYGHDGSIAFTTFTASVQSSGGTFTENVYLPSSAGLHPIVGFSPGMEQPSAAYAAYATRLASWGILVLMRDDPGSLVETPSVEADLATTLQTWLPAENTKASSALYGRVDMTRIGLAGHSRGGQATLLAASNELKGKVRAWFGLDPIDTADVSPVLARTNLGAIGIPSTFLGASISGACSPASDNYNVLYPLAPSPSVSITGIGAGHTQFEDPASCVYCEFCTPVGTANGSVVLAYAVRYLTAFFARELLNDASVGATFTGAGAPADTSAGLITLTSK